MKLKQYSAILLSYLFLNYSTLAENKVTVTETSKINNDRYKIDKIDLNKVDWNDPKLNEMMLSDIRKIDNNISNSQKQITLEPQRKSLRKTLLQNTFKNKSVSATTMFPEQSLGTSQTKVMTRNDLERASRTMPMGIQTEKVNSNQMQSPFGSIQGTDPLLERFKNNPQMQQTIVENMQENNQNPDIKIENNLPQVTTLANLPKDDSVKNLSELASEAKKQFYNQGQNNKENRAAPEELIGENNLPPQNLKNNDKEDFAQQPSQPQPQLNQQPQVNQQQPTKPEQQSQVQIIKIDTPDYYKNQKKPRIKYIMTEQQYQAKELNLPDVHQNRYHSRHVQITPPNISQKVYTGNNKHLTPVVFQSEYDSAAFKILIKNYHQDDFNAILQKISSVNVQDQNGNTLLHYAVATNNVNAMLSLLNYDINYDIKNDIGYTPLHYACYNGGVQIAFTLIKGSGTDVNESDNEGNTPIMLAALSGSYPIVRILAENGANLDTVNNKGLSIIDFAIYSKDRAVIEYLMHIGISAVNSRA